MGRRVEECGVRTYIVGVAGQSEHLGFFFIKEMRNHRKVLGKRREELNLGFKNVVLAVYGHPH